MQLPRYRYLLFLHLVHSRYDTYAPLEALSVAWVHSDASSTESVAMLSRMSHRLQLLSFSPVVTFSSVWHEQLWRSPATPAILTGNPFASVNLPAWHCTRALHSPATRNSVLSAHSTHTIAPTPRTSLRLQFPMDLGGRQKGGSSPNAHVAPTGRQALPYLLSLAPWTAICPASPQAASSTHWPESRYLPFRQISQCPVLALHRLQCVPSHTGAGSHAPQRTGHVSAKSLTAKHSAFGKDLQIASSTLPWQAFGVGAEVGKCVVGFRVGAGVGSADGVSVGCGDGRGVGLQLRQRTGHFAFVDPLVSGLRQSSSASVLHATGSGRPLHRVAVTVVIVVTVVAEVVDDVRVVVVVVIVAVVLVVVVVVLLRDDVVVEVDIVALDVVSVVEELVVTQRSHNTRHAALRSAPMIML